MPETRPYQKKGRTISQPETRPYKRKGRTISQPADLQLRHSLQRCVLTFTSQQPIMTFPWKDVTRMSPLDSTLPPKHIVVGSQEAGPATAAGWA